MIPITINTNPSAAASHGLLIFFESAAAAMTIWAVPSQTRTGCRSWKRGSRTFRSTDVDDRTGPVSARNPVNATVQVFDVTQPAGHRLSVEEPTPSPFSPHFPAGHQEIDLCPWNFVLPDGRMLVHCRNSTRYWHPGTPGHWDPTILKAQRNESRTYPGQGTCVLLPLLPEDGYRVRVMAIGAVALTGRSSTRAATTMTRQRTPSS